MAGEKEPAGGGRYARVIREARRGAGVNQQALAEGLGVSRATVAGWETGHSRPDLDLLPSLCDAIGLSLNGFFGLGNASPEEERLLAAFRGLPPGDRQALIWQVEALLAGRRAESERRQAVRETGARGKGRSAAPHVPRRPERSPLVSLYRSDWSAAAGTGVPLEGARGRRVWLRQDEMTCRADEIVAVNGHSMEPTFQDGDEVLVEHTARLREGEIGLFLVNGEGYIKEYRADGLHSHNPDYPTMTFGEESDVRCVGRVLGRVDDSQRVSEEEAAEWDADTEEEMK